VTRTGDSNAKLVAQIRGLQVRVQEAEETLTAIRSGQVDALVVSGPEGDQVFTLQGADHSFRMLVETMSEGALTVAADGVILYENPRFARMIGRPLEKIEGSRLADHVVEADQFLLDGLIREGLTGTSYGALRLQTTGGSTVPVYFASSRMGAETDDAVALCIVITDLTQLRDSEERLLKQERAGRAVAEAAVHMRDEFVAIASHELRTPLTGIKTTVQLLLSEFERGVVQPVRAIERLKRVNAMSDRLALLISELLDVTRLRTGQLELRLEPLDVYRLAQQVVDELAPQHSLVLSIVGSLPAIAGDTFRMHQVLANVLQNAIKYSPAGGDVEVSLRARDGGILVSVLDHGMGLPPEALETIFEPFGRASNAQRSQLPGMGLGLYITRRIVEQHGGRIWADSAGEGLGTQINIWLPGIGAAAVRKRPLRVLVVDDEALIRSTLGDLFELEGYDCRVAANGREALRVLAEWGADLIVLDLMMPIMDGWAFRREQQIEPAVCDIPVVVISARQSHDSRDAELAPTAELTKPFELSALVDTVHYILTHEGEASSAMR
jgi:PAS domain S-box-containing protein